MLNVKSRWHNFLIAAQTIAVILVLMKLVIYPTRENLGIAPINFPETITLDKWQQLATKPLQDKLIPDLEYFTGENLGGYSYQYDVSGRTLTIEMRYLVNTNGDLKYFVKDSTGTLEPYLYQKPGMGFYAMYPVGDRLYLTTCINPHGETSLTSDRFRRNGLRHAINPKRIFIWLTSQHKIIDNRCLWVYLSMPMDNNTPEAIYPLLENAWFNWHQWWKNNYPNSKI